MALVAWTYSVMNHKEKEKKKEYRTMLQEDFTAFLHYKYVLQRQSIIDVWHCILLIGISFLAYHSKCKQNVLPVVQVVQASQENLHYPSTVRGIKLI